MFGPLTKILNNISNNQSHFTVYNPPYLCAPPCNGSSHNVRPAAHVQPQN